MCGRGRGAPEIKVDPPLNGANGIYFKTIYLAVVAIKPMKWSGKVSIWGELFLNSDEMHFRAIVANDHELAFPNDEKMYV